LKIIIAHKFLRPLGGAEKVVLDLSRLLESKGHSLAHFAVADERNIHSRYSPYFPSPPDLEALRRKGSLGRKVASAFKVIWNEQARRQFRRLVRATDADLLHLHMFSRYLSPSILYAAHDLSLPALLHLHDYSVICPAGSLLRKGGEICPQGGCTGGNFYRAVMGRCVRGSVVASSVMALEAYIANFLHLYRGSLGFLSPSRFLKGLFLRAGFSPENITFLPNFIFAEHLEPSLNPGGYMLYFGRIVPEKGLEVLLDAASKLRHIPFVIAGEGALKDNLAILARERGLENVRFVGFKKGRELEDIIRSCRATLLPSIWFENCPLSLLESFALGKPVIASRIGGIPELLQHGWEGFLFEPGNSQDLSEKIEALWRDGDLCVEMGRKARQRVLIHHHPDTYHRRLERIYRRVLELRRS